MWHVYSQKKSVTLRGCNAKRRDTVFAQTIISGHMNTEKQMSAAAAEFAERWKGRGYERGESQPFWIDLLTNVFGIETPTDGFIRFEEHRMVDASNFIDGRIPSTRVLIEQKSLGKDLRSGIRQSDGSLLNPFLQARRYVVSLPVSEHPRWIFGGLRKRRRRYSKKLTRYLLGT